jgi:prepilin-type N-terminal cleavage/methylation domain-containing protein
MERPRTTGFTLIEIIVSLGVFSVVITIAVGALLMLVAANDQLQSEQAVMTNLSFALDSMTREIRTGTNYYCDSADDYGDGGLNNIFKDDYNLDALGDQTRDCPTGREDADDQLHGLSFAEGGNSITGSSDRILYFHSSSTDPVTGEPDGKLYRKVGDDRAVSIVASDIFIHDAQFYVSGADPLSGGTTERDQASVTIYIEASRTSDPSGKRYNLQTTVTQRTLDI